MNLLYIRPINSYLYFTQTNSKITEPVNLSLLCLRNLESYSHKLFTMLLNVLKNYNRKRLPNQQTGIPNCITGDTSPALIENKSPIFWFQLRFTWAAISDTFVKHFVKSYS